MLESLDVFGKVSIAQPNGHAQSIGETGRAIPGTCYMWRALAAATAS